MENLQQRDAELAKELQAIADHSDALVLSFIAPGKPVKTSPVDFDYAQITVEDIYNLERKLEDLQDRNNLPKNLQLVVHTPGGSLYATTKIAMYLRLLFEKIEVYVPYEAASGGTVLCLAANDIIMDKLANLTPIDPQTTYKGEYVSAASFQQAADEIKERFSKFRPAQIPSPYQQMCAQIDPVILKEKNKIVTDAIMVAWDLLKKSQNPKSAKKLSKQEQDAFTDKDWKLLNIAVSLARTTLPHSHIFGREEAEAIGLNIVKSTDERFKRLKTYKRWVSINLDETRTDHIIDHFVPVEAKKIVGEPQKTENKDEKKISV